MTVVVGGVVEGDRRRTLMCWIVILMVQALVQQWRWRHVWQQVRREDERREEGGKRMRCVCVCLWK